MEARFQEPKGWAWGCFANPDGAGMRYGHIKAEGARRGTLVIAPGFNESIEKYFETIGDFRRRGFDIWIFDWRGQGGSERYLKDNHKPYSNGFDKDVRDLEHFVTTIVNPARDKTLPLVLAAHSMGGHIALRHLHDYPKTFNAAILSAPLLDIAGEGYPKWMIGKLVGLSHVFRLSKSYIPGGKPWSKRLSDLEVRENRKSQDPVRKKVQDEYYVQKKELQLGDPTYGWLYHMLKSIRTVKKEDYLKQITTPILMATPYLDDIVDVEAQLRASMILPNCARIDYPNSKHEIWMELDNLRNDWFLEIDKFLANLSIQSKVVGPKPGSGPPPKP